jgi:hypothetical protein
VLAPPDSRRPASWFITLLPAYIPLTPGTCPSGVAVALAAFRTIV